MYKIKHLDLATVALYSFVMTLIISVIIFIPVGLFFTAMIKLAQDSMPGFDQQMFPLANFGFLFFLFAAIFYAVIATIVNTIIALVYNILSLKLGGIRIKMETVEEITAIDSHVEGLDEVK